MLGQLSLKAVQEKGVGLLRGLPLAVTDDDRNELGALLAELAQRASQAAQFLEESQQAHAIEAARLREDLQRSEAALTSAKSAGSLERDAIRKELQASDADARSLLEMAQDTMRGYRQELERAKVLEHQALDIEERASAAEKALAEAVAGKAEREAYIQRLEDANEQRRQALAALEDELQKNEHYAGTLGAALEAALADSRRLRERFAQIQRAAEQAQRAQIRATQAPAPAPAAKAAPSRPAAKAAKS